VSTWQNKWTPIAHPATESGKSPGQLKTVLGGRLQSFTQLLHRLDDAIASFWETETMIDEINAPRRK
jgi:hypothetical protein